MSRTQAKREFNVDDLEKQTEGVECRKDKQVIDEIPGAYKSIVRTVFQKIESLSFSYAYFVATRG